MLCVAGYPGALRFIFFLAGGIYFSQAAISEAGASLSILMLLSYFTSVGWCSLLFSDYKKEKLRDDIPFKLLAYSSLTVVFVSCVSPLFGDFFSLTVVSCIYFLFSWSTYQIVRHTLIVQKKYKVIFFIELVLTVIFFGITAFIWNIHYNQVGLIPLYSSLWLVLSIILFFIARPYIIPLKRQGLFLEGNLVRKGAVSSASNFLSGGALYLLTPVSKLAMSDAMTSQFFMMTLFIQMSILLPRSIAINYLPAMARLETAKEIEMSVKYFRKKFILINVFTIVLCLLLWSFYVQFLVKSAVYSVFDLAPIFISLLLASVFSVLNMPIANACQILGVQRFNFYSNVIFFISILTSFLLLDFVGHELQQANILAFSLLVATIARNLLNAKLLKGESLNREAL